MTDDLLTSKTPKVKITATDIKAAMRKTWGAPEYAVLWEVAPATGYGHKPRYADAMIMGLWPSRGLELHGVEIKVSRSDWKREAADPEKAEALAKFCDRWWIHTCPGVIHDLAEVPLTWGVREWNGKRWNTLREATLTEAAPCDRKVLASLMRRATESVQPLAQQIASEMLESERAKIASEIERGIADGIGRKDRNTLIVEQLEAELGLKFKDHLTYQGNEPAEVGALIKTILESGILTGYRSLAQLIASMDSAADSIERARNDLITHAKANVGPYVEALENVPERKKAKGLKLSTLW